MKLKNGKTKTVCLIAGVLLISAVTYGAVNYAVLKGCGGKKLNLSDSCTVTAHTGSMGTPDNSVESLEKAIAIGADAAEFDVRFRPNGTPVMAHDSVGSDTEGVPIEEALKVLSREGVNIRINLDVKETDNLSALRGMLMQYGLSERSFFTGVTEEFVPEVIRQCPDIPYYLNLSPEKKKLNNAEYRRELIEILDKTGAIGINCNYKNANRALADLLHRNGYLLSVWTVDREDQMAGELAKGSDNITTKAPDRLIDLINRLRSNTRFMAVGGKNALKARAI